MSCFRQNSDLMGTYSGMGSMGGMQPYTAMPGMQYGAMPAFPGTTALPAVPTAPALPSGVPTGPAFGTVEPTAITTPIAPAGQQAPQTIQSTLYTPGYLRTQIGRRMRVEFLIGTGTLIDRTGTLVGVGASYILLQPVDTDDIMLCDIYSIKFATVLF